MRIDKYLWNLWIIDRSEVGQWTRRWLISVDGIHLRKQSDHVQVGQTITIHHLDHDQQIPVVEHMTIMIHKPSGYVSSNVEDGWHPSYRELLWDRPYAKLMNPAGRLDIDTTWLLLCTSNNELMHRIIHPNRKVGKTYLVTSMLELTDQELDQLRRGVEIEDNGNTIITKSALITRIDTHHIILTIFEWRYHQIKKMLLSINNKVVWLHRAAIGSLMLDSLAVGDFVQLSEEQINSMFEVDYTMIHASVADALQTK